MTLKVKKIEDSATYHVDHGAEKYQPGRYGIFDAETRVGTIVSKARRYMDPASWEVQTYRDGFASRLRGCHTLREAKEWALTHPDKFGRPLTEVFSEKNQSRGADET